MNQGFRCRCVWLITTCAGVELMTDRASACSVCFGDPDSDMARGVAMGVLVLVGVVGTVLAGFVGTGLFWIQRSRRLGDGNETQAD